MCLYLGLYFIINNITIYIINNNTYILPCRILGFFLTLESPRENIILVFLTHYTMREPNIPLYKLLILM